MQNNHIITMHTLLPTCVSFQTARCLERTWSSSLVGEEQNLGLGLKTSERSL